MTQSAPCMNSVSSVFCASLELSVSRWKVVFTDGGRIRGVSIPSGDLIRFEDEVQKARKKLGIPSEAQLFTCYEAGRDGFWIHRRLLESGICNIVVDPSSIQVNRRARRAKTDNLDAESLAKLLVRHVRGERGVWQVVRVPTVAEEDARRLHRERERLTREKTAHQSRIRSLFALHGVVVTSWLRAQELLKRVPQRLGAEIERELARRKVVVEQMAKLDEERLQSMNDNSLPSADKIRHLEMLKGIGPRSATVLVSEFFSWREFKSGKQVGACAGLTPTPFASGKLEREQGISKAGSRRIRAMCVEIGWAWLRYQPESELSRWFEQRFAKGNGRSRRVGIVALARKLLVALWRYTAHGVIPEGAIMKA